jgi:hypothetical protein
MPVKFEMDLGEFGARLEFATPHDMRTWNQHEFNQWTRLWEAGKPHTDHILSVHRQFVHELNEQINRWEQVVANDQQSETIFGHINNVLQRYYRERTILNSTSAAGRFVLDVKDSRGPVVAAGAYAALVTSAIRIQGDVKPEILHGFIDAFLFKREVDWTAGAHEKVLNDLKNRYEQEIVRQNRRFEEIERTNATLNTSFDPQIREKVGALETLHHTQVDEFKKLIDEHVGKLKAIEETFTQKLALQAPVQYWETRQKYHRNQSGWWGGTGVLVLLVLCSGMAWLIHWAFAKLAPNENPKHWQLGILLVAVFFSIWVMRIMVRMFLSHMHLATDAAERRTMILTYLSMAREGEQVKPEDKNLILQHIFRSASDGLVKDDAAPPGFWELLTRK